MRIHWGLQTVAAVTALAAAQHAPNIGTSAHYRDISDPHEAKLPRPEHVEMLIGLHPDKREDFERTLYEISSPYHENYGRYLTREEAKSLLRPSAQASDSVKRWLLDQDVPEPHVEDNGQWIRAHVPIALAGTLSKCMSSLSKRRFRPNESMRESLLPESVRRHISAVQMTKAPRVPRPRTVKRSNTRIPNPIPKATHESYERRQRSEDDVDLEKCKTELTPACIREIYNMDERPAKPHFKSLFGVPGFNGQAAQYAELEEFIARFALYATGANFSVDLVNGGENPQGEYPSGEANLDIQYAIAMTYNVSVQYLAVGGEYRDFIPDLDIPDPEEQWVEPYLELAAHLVDLPDDKLPQVISISYGINEQVLPESYARQVCDMFGQLGTRGVSVISAAGNHGPGTSCLANDGSNSTKFLPLFPGSCPYVTAVGATEGNSPEVAMNFSAGGFSEFFDQPGWQRKVIENYLKVHGKEWEGYYNPEGRAYPDVAALGWGHQIVNHGAVETTGGTSAASPVFAAMIALINNRRFHQGKPPMGFLNPWIYSIGDAGFTDITEGRSIGCEGESIAGLPSPVIPNAGWSAVEGWDPITGFGTPRFDRLKKLACW